MAPRDWFDALRLRRRGRGPSGRHPVQMGAVPAHVAIIMDGNGRWARRHHLPVAAGHRAGTRAVRRVVETAREVGIRQLTLYSFSTENWTRPPDEVEELMRLHGEMIESEVPELHRNECRVVFVGRRDRLGAGLLERMQWAEALTADDDGMVLFIAFDYGGRQEIVDAVRGTAQEGIDPSAIEERDIAAHLYSPLMKDPDLVIRTSGERRLSNFLLWQSAYSELYFSEELWPDFGREQLLEAIDDYGRRERRFGARGDTDAAGVETGA